MTTQLHDIASDNHAYINQLSNHVGAEVVLKGWLYNMRSSGKILFPQLRDGTGVVQGVVLKNAISPELWEQLGGRLDAFVYGSGTGGTISGVGRYLKERNPEVLVVAVEPARSPVLSGGERGQHKFQGMGPGFVPPNFDRSVVDRVERAWEEDAFPLARRLAREEGLFVGMSSGAIAWVALKVARELGPGRRVAMIAPDGGSRYLSTALFVEDAGSGEPEPVL